MIQFKWVAAVVADIERPIFFHATGDHRGRCVAGRGGEERYCEDRCHRHEDGDERHDGDEVGYGGVGFHGDHVRFSFCLRTDSVRDYRYNP